MVRWIRSSSVEIVSVIAFAPSSKHQPVGLASEPVIPRLSDQNLSAQLRSPKVMMRQG